MRLRRAFGEGQRVGFLALGGLMLALGIIGAFLPVMPTTIFLILAAWCFGRSSPRLESWMLDHQRFGPALRQWREHRRLSQLALALDAEISTRHLSFVETGRSLPSREMVLRLAERLEVPLRERNRLLLAAGYAPVYAESGLDSPPMAPSPAGRRVGQFVTASINS